MKSGTGWAVAGGIFACGCVIWRVPYKAYVLPGNPSAPTLIVAGSAAGIFAGYLIRQQMVRPVLAVTCGFGVAVMMRVIFEAIRDPTSHNLWPFELIIVGGTSLFAALIGVGLARVVQSLMAKTR